jgi:hypothetical protein
MRTLRRINLFNLDILRFRASGLWTKRVAPAPAGAHVHRRYNAFAVDPELPAFASNAWMPSTLFNSIFTHHHPLGDERFRTTHTRPTFPKGSASFFGQFEGGSARGCGPRYLNLEARRSIERGYRLFL